MSLKSIIEELRDFDSALLANTLGYVDPTPAHEIYMDAGIQSVTPGLGPTVGVAITCECDTSTPGGTADASIYWETLQAMEKMDVPSVWVVKCYGSRPRHECVIGDGMGKTLHAAGCVGLVTDGGVRDVPGLLTTPFAAYCRGVCIHHTALRFRNFKAPVDIGGITVRTGDVIHASAEGVIRLPAGALEPLPAKATSMRAFEHAAHRVLRRTDLSASQKRDAMAPLLQEYGFSDCATHR
jgi:4-hydroxy-4-methyl-2-oxoglutarate aldolase